ncbi:hypothetical protein IMAU10572_00801 [Lactiplantibacillus plantarum]|nr:hypothetical protein [Lactiplantibacillus plantarum]
MFWGIVINDGSEHLTKNICVIVFSLNKGFGVPSLFDQRYDGGFICSLFVFE